MDLEEGVVSGIYAEGRHYDVLAQMTAPKDADFYRDLVREHGGPVLELGCGTGRVAQSLAERGVEVVGVDTAEPLLSWAREKVAAMLRPPKFVRQDVRTLALERTFPLVVFPYNGFNHMLSHDDIASSLRSVREHLADEGRFVIDTFNPDPLRLKPSSDVAVILRYRDPYSEHEVGLSEHNAYDAARQVNTITWRYQIDGRDDARIDVLEMRMFFPQELDAHLRHNGFVICDKRGDYDGRDFVAAAPKQLVICRRA